MDFSRLTLGMLLSSEDVTIKRNAMSILKVCQRCDHKYEQGHCIYCFTKDKTYECKHDFDNYGKCTKCGRWKTAITCKTCDMPLNDCVCIE